MHRSLKRAFFCIQPSFYIVLAAAMLVLPLAWISAWLSAGLIHELGHYAMIRLCGKSVYVIRINWNGMIMETEELGNSEWLCAMAGPLFGLLLLPLCRWFPRLAVCALVQSALNLLPIYPADGGRVLSGALKLRLPDSTVHVVTTTVSGTVIAALIVMDLCLMWRYSVNLLSIAFMTVLFVKTVAARISCKDERILVQ